MGKTSTTAAQSDAPRDFLGVELVATGKWVASTGEVDITPDMLAELARTSRETARMFHAPLRLGHDDLLATGDGMPAAGWVDNLRVVGNKLVGDLKAVPAKLARLIETGGYRHRSAELRADYVIGGKQFPWALTGLALLGAALPAVDGLADIVSTYLSHGLGPSAPGVIALAHGNSTFPRVAMFAAPKSETGSMDYAALVQELMKMLGVTTPEELKAKIGAMFAAPAPTVAAAEPAPVPAPVAVAAARAPDPEMTALRARVLAMEVRDSEASASALVEGGMKAGKLTPGTRDSALNFARKDPAGFAAFLAAAPVVIKLGETGSSIDAAAHGGVDLARLHPTDSDRHVAALVGNDLSRPDNLRAFMATKARLLGVAVSAEQLKAAITG